MLIFANLDQSGSKELGEGLSVLCYDDECGAALVTKVTNVAADSNRVTMLPSSGGRIWGPEERSLRCREMGRDSACSQHCPMVSLDTSPPPLYRVGYSGKFTA